MHSLLSENKPEVDEMFILPEADEHLHGGSRRIHFEPDLKQDKSGTFTIWLEDHTVGHALRKQLLKNPHVLFAGYKVPHPLEHKMVMRVQVSKDSPVAAMKVALRQLAELSLKVCINYVSYINFLDRVDITSRFFRY
jgi:DNA-directed RNA polymerase II subunit RPB11